MKKINGIYYSWKRENGYNLYAIGNDGIYHYQKTYKTMRQLKEAVLIRTNMEYKNE